MSRIHDALKRAEQERATSMGTHVESTFDQPQLQPDGPRENMPSLQPSGATVMPSASGMTYESLLARCPQVEWHPDSRTMLFFQETTVASGRKSSALCAPASTRYARRCRSNACS